MINVGLSIFPRVGYIIPPEIQVIIDNLGPDTLAILLAIQPVVEALP